MNHEEKPGEKDQASQGREASADAVQRGTKEGMGGGEEEIVTVTGAQLASILQKLLQEVFDPYADGPTLPEYQGRWLVGEACHRVRQMSDLNRVEISK